MRPDVLEVYKFSARCIEKHDETNQTTKEKTTKYYFSIERFEHTCKVSGIAQEDLAEAEQYAIDVATWATEAPDIAVIEARRKRWGRG